MEADDKIPEVLTGNHAIGVLANQNKVWLEGPAAGRIWKRNHQTGPVVKVTHTVRLFRVRVAKNSGSFDSIGRSRARLVIQSRAPYLWLCYMCH